MTTPSDARPVRALHVTNWYPNDDSPHEAVFVKEYVDSLAEHGRHEVVHVQVRADRKRFRFRIGRRSNRERFVVADVPFPQSRVVEWITAFLLVIARLWVGRRWWSVVQVHIAYPLLCHRGLFRFLFGGQLVLGEHWSAYRFGFHLPEKSEARRRMIRMFRPDIPVIVVSEALAEDIRSFCVGVRLTINCIPNVVRPDVFHYSGGLRPGGPGSFLMVANWAPIKLPFLVLEAVVELLPRYPNLRIRIVGYGHQLDEMKRFVAERKIADQVEFLGALTKPEIAAELRRSSALLHPSAYETFSVVCAEALCCGVPVIASNVGAIPEVVGGDGILVENTVAAWQKALDDFMQNPPTWDLSEVSSRALLRFSPESVAASALSVLAKASVG